MGKLTSILLGFIKVIIDITKMQCDNVIVIKRLQLQKVELGGLLI